jgi:hypothetical protein
MWYTAPELPVYQFTGHGDLVQKEHRDVDVETEQATSARAGAREGLLARPVAAGMASSVADDLLDGHDACLVTDALDALELRRVHNPAGWLVRAIDDGWDLAADAANCPGPACPPCCGGPSGTRRPRKAEANRCDRELIDGWLPRSRAPSTTTSSAWRSGGSPRPRPDSTGAASG